MPKKFEELLTFLEREGNVVSYSVPLEADLARSLDLPRVWQGGLIDAKSRKDQIFRIWAPLADLLPRTRAMYAKHCVSLVVVKTDQVPISLLYCFDIGKSWTARRGFLPTNRLPEVASRFPVDLSPFYAVHDGLVHFASEEAGPLPVSRWDLVPDPARGGGLLEFLTEGARGLGFDTGTEPLRAYWLDADDADNPVEEVPEVWKFVDGYLARWLERRK